MNTGSGDDNVTAAAGINNITTGANDDQITLTGGTNTVNTGDNNDVVNSSGGDSNITTEKPLTEKKKNSKRVDINILKSKMQRAENLEFKKNIFIFSLLVIVLAFFAIYLTV